MGACRRSPSPFWPLSASKNRGFSLLPLAFAFRHGSIWRRLRRCLLTRSAILDPLLLFLLLQLLSFGVGDVAEHLYPARILLGGKDPVLLVYKYIRKSAELSRIAPVPAEVCE